LSEQGSREWTHVNGHVKMQLEKAGDAYSSLTSRGRARCEFWMA